MASARTPSLDTQPSTPGPRPKRRASWHRQASRPIIWWMAALLISVGVHPVIPQYRWLLVHMVTLGLVTTSVMLWGQHFAEALLKTRLAEETRPTQVRRLWIHTGMIAVTMIGMVAGLPVVTVLGAVGVSATVLWWAGFLIQQIRAAVAPRFAFVIRTYATAAMLLPIGAALGAVLAFSPGEPWQGRLLLAHQLVNILGFLGLTACATLFTLWPTILRTRMRLERAQRTSAMLIVMLVGLLIAVGGALMNNVLMGAAGLVLYLVGFLVIASELARLAVQSARQKHAAEVPLFPALSMGAGIVWFAGTLVALLVMWISHTGAPVGEAAASPLNFSLLASTVKALTVPFVVGFGLQLLLGAMSFLMPTIMGGGPRAVQAGLAEMSRLAVFRVVALNLAIALFALSESDALLPRALFLGLTFGTGAPEQFGSVSRILVSLLALLVLASFIVLMKRMVRASVRERLQQRADLGMPAAPPTQTGQLAQAGRPAETARPTDSAATNLNRRHLTGAVLAVASVLGLSAMGRAADPAATGSAASGSGSSPGAGTGDGTAAVLPTGRTTSVTVRAKDTMRFDPDRITVPAGDELVITVINDDPTQIHDLVLDTGAASGRISAGQRATLKAGVIDRSITGWCSIVGHRSMGMELQIVADGAPSGTESSSDSRTAGHSHHGAEPGDAGADPLARVTADFGEVPSVTARDPRMPEPVGPALEITAGEKELEIAPGVMMQAMPFNGTVMGPVIRADLGQEIAVTVTNRGAMEHSMDFHAGTVSPSVYMQGIKPGASLHYPLTTDHAGIWLYHCSTMPMTHHLSGGMFGAVIVPPRGIAAADREYVLVQSDHYLSPTEKSGTGAHAISADKIHAERPDFTVFNGHATQYVHEPLTAKVGERIRIWVLAAGPTRSLSFHVVGAVFDTVFKEGEYLLRPDNPNGGGAQALDLSSAQGGFVEMVFREPGTYTAVNHAFADMERGARALITVTQ
ncbi:multicopper oxidase domain-containing protein [Helcobacillus massiliensis]|uniref:Nitrite reductase (NO-forming) n=1 Tax=Helcobacillus massiliensis TaxID=521392 RepID=A0A839QRD7_9MICO|nr:multicopper oxidase domain-containing protein [Helcobacillus massiliensis]MBB3023033.1 nitrite reductase (NO-forming) [Helcobacillus massiliensis]